MPLAKQDQYISEQEYLAGEKLSSERYEYLAGEVVAMASSSKRHNRIAFNIAKSLDDPNSACHVYISDMKVHIKARQAYYYPDVVVGCEPDDADEYYLNKPCLIVEVLSDSTRQKDYQEKLLAYQTLENLKAYLIVSQDKVQVDCFYRDQNNWWVKHYDQLSEVIDLTCPKRSLSLTEIYLGIVFS